MAIVTHNQWRKKLRKYVMAEIISILRRKLIESILCILNLLRKKNMIWINLKLMYIYESHFGVKNHSVPSYAKFLFVFGRRRRHFLRAGRFGLVCIWLLSRRRRRFFCTCYRRRGQWGWGSCFHRWWASSSDGLMLVVEGRGECCSGFNR